MDCIANEEESMQCNGNCQYCMFAVNDDEYAEYLHDELEQDDEYIDFEQEEN